MAIKSNQNVVLMDASGRSVEYARLQMRRGLESQFDASKMLPAEFAVTTDAKKAYLAFAAGDVKRLSTYEDMTQDLADALAEIEQEYLGQISTATAQAQAATSAANTATQDAKNATANATAAADEARQAVWNNKNITNSTSASESQVETAAGAAVLTGVDGKTEHVTTTGAQLFPFTKKTYSANGLTAEIQEDGSVIVNGTPNAKFAVVVNLPIQLKPGDYKISGGSISEGCAYAQISITKNGEVKYYSNTKFTIDGTETSISGTIQVGAYLTAINNYNFSPMLNKGTETLPIEPYTGGVPGPNPDYPLPVQGIGGKTGDESFGFNAVIQSYQLFDASKVKGKSQGGASVTNNGDGTFTVSGDGELTENFVDQSYLTHAETISLLTSGTLYADFSKSSVPTAYVNLKKSDGTDYVTMNNSSTTSSSVQITDDMLNDGGCVLYYSFYGAVGKEIAASTVKIMLYQNGNGEWQPYHRSTIPITLDFPLFDGDTIVQIKSGQTYVNSGGSMQTANCDLWGVFRKNAFKKISSSDVTREINQLTNSKEIRILNFGAAKSANDLQMYSNRFTKVSTTWGDDVVGIFSTSGENNAEISFRIPISNDASWFDSNDTWVVTESKFLYFEPFTDQAPFFAWTTPTGGCTITTDDQLKPIISADTAQTPEGSYLLTGYIDGLRGRTLEQRILELEKTLYRGYNVCTK